MKYFSKRQSPKTAQYLNKLNTFPSLTTIKVKPMINNSQQQKLICNISFNIFTNKIVSNYRLYFFLTVLWACLCWPWEMNRLHPHRLVKKTTELCGPPQQPPLWCVWCKSDLYSVHGWLNPFTAVPLYYTVIDELMVMWILDLSVAAGEKWLLK